MVKVKYSAEDVRRLLEDPAARSRVYAKFVRKACRHKDIDDKTRNLLARTVRVSTENDTVMGSIIAHMILVFADSLLSGDDVAINMGLCLEQSLKQQKMIKAYEATG